VGDRNHGRSRKPGLARRTVGCDNMDCGTEPAHSLTKLARVNALAFGGSRECASHIFVLIVPTHVLNLVDSAPAGEAFNATRPSIKPKAFRDPAARCRWISTLLETVRALRVVPRQIHRHCRRVPKWPGRAYGIFHPAAHQRCHARFDLWPDRHRIHDGL